jgi:hypothetical protein
MSHICANDEYRSQVGATNRLENIVIRYVSVSLSLSRQFTCERSRRFQFSFTDFSLVYRSAFAQIFPRSQSMRGSNTSDNTATGIDLESVLFVCWNKKSSFADCLFPVEYKFRIELNKGKMETGQFLTNSRK